MSNVSKMLYTGVTNDLEKRVFEHKFKRIPGFTEKYNLFKLVYFEAFGDIRDAIRREKEIKGWLRSKKVVLIESVNPQWKDLAEDHYKSGVKFKGMSSGGPDVGPKDLNLRARQDGPRRLLELWFGASA
jgi:putative endonuclease